MTDFLYKKALLNRIEKKTEKFFKQYGFIKDKTDNVLYRYNHDFYEIIQSYGSQVDGMGFFYKTEGLSKRIKVIEDIWEDLKIKVGIEDRKNYKSIDVSIYQFYPDLEQHPNYSKIRKGFRAAITEDGIDEYISILKPIFENYLFPTSQKLNDIREIDKLVNPSVDSPYRGDVYRRIIIAKLANNPLYNEIVEYYRSNYKKGLENGQNFTLEDSEKFSAQMSVFEEIVSRLKNTAPMENPILN